MSFITDQQITDFQNDGAVLIKGLFTDWVDQIADAIEENMARPGPYAAENLQAGEQGRFFDDYCNWQSIALLEQIMAQSPAPQAAADLMQSDKVQFFHDHVLVKEPGTAKPTPWHQDAPYYFVEGMQTISFWIPIDPVSDATLRCVKGSHKWDKLVLPVRWLKEDNFYDDNEAFMPVPDPDDPSLGLEVLEWEMAPGDAVAFHYRSLHGAKGNLQAHRRRALSLRYVGDDARFVLRQGRTSPPFPDHGMMPGERLREDWFPTVWPQG